MKSLVKLLRNVLLEIGDVCSVDTTRDFKTISSRVENEGTSFITISLPNFGKDFEKSLDQGRVTHDMFAGFAFHAGLPRLFGGFLELVFDRASGTLLHEPSIDSIRSLRQITLMFGKVKVDCTEDRIKSAFDKFMECESDLERVLDTITISDRKEFRRVSTVLFDMMFKRVDDKIGSFDIMPKHGPGATAEKLIANAKYTLPEWTSRLESVFPYWRYGTSRAYATSVYEKVKISEPGEERPVRVVSVPKTLKTPRIIAIEPTCMQYMQQGILEALNESIDRDNTLVAMISTVSQEPNQLLAQKGSVDGTLATLDLSEASDRVSNWLVQDLLANTPHLLDATMASRSTHADVPYNGVIPLVKFASMGSALCFPMEMFVFTTLVFMGIQKARGIRFTDKAQIKAFVGQVRIYGDDIIVPIDTTASVIETLHLFGFKVNMNKSFWTGKFRESCGAEYYDGHDVTLARVRQVLPASRRDADSVVSTVDLRNQLYKRGFWSTVRYLDDLISKIIPFPAVAETSTALGKFSFLGYEEKGTCSKLHKPVVWGCAAKYTPRRSHADGDAALMKFFLKRGDEPTFSKNHLEYAGRPIASSINYGRHYSY